MQGLRFSFNKRSIVLTWFLSYAVILLLPVIIGILVYFESSRTLKEEIDSANESLLKQVREVMDNQFQTMERLNLEMTWNLKVQEVLFPTNMRCSRRITNTTCTRFPRSLKSTKRLTPSLICSIYT
ncbi:hypothetical protein N6H14_07640 [Paenibacillus sp. CC-CFT747]|nr:hypothetical protein N6H14_07640 [Paenibacillus sp. CC-CFT747]